MKLILFSVWFWLVDAFKGIPILFRKLWLSSSTLEQRINKILPVKCKHGFNQLDVVKYKKNAKCKHCGVKLKVAEKEMS